MCQQHISIQESWTKVEYYLLELQDRVADTGTTSLKLNDITHPFQIVSIVDGNVEQ